jgi:beta-lactamase regulating signal transducer with metallopeptidase domain
MREVLSHLPLLLKISGEASILILLVLAAQRLCGQHLKPRWRYALWLLVILRLALPWSVPSSASLFNFFPFASTLSTTSSIRGESAPPEIPGRPPLDVSAATVNVPPTHPILSSTFSFAGNWQAWLLGLWAAGVVFLTLFALICQYRFLRRVAPLRPLTDCPTLNLLEDCKVLMGVTTPISVIETDLVKGPTLFGFVRPRLLLPSGLRSAFTREELRHVFLHELAHVKRHDILTGWITLALQIIHWFNPLVWLAFYRLRTDRELACDALALVHAQTGENESYGLTIVKLLEGFGQPVWGPSLAGILENKKQMKERIIMIAKFHKTDRGIALAVLLLAGLALVTITDAQTAPSSGEPDAAKGVWAVRFEPVGDFSPKTPGEFLSKIHIFSGQHGNIGYFRTTKQGDKLVGSFLAYDGDQLKAALERIPALKVTAVEKLTAEQLTAYEKSPQESLASGPAMDFNHLDADKGVWAVRFEPVGNFAPKNPGEFLSKIHIFSGQHGAIGYFRTTKQGDKLVGSFLAYNGDELKAALEKIPEIKVTAVDKLTAEQLTVYEQSPQESLVTKKAATDFEQRSAAKGVWAVRFELTGKISPTTPEEFLGYIHKYAKCQSGEDGQIGYFRTTKKGDKLVASFLADNPDQFKAALSRVPDLNVTSVDKLTAEEMAAYEKLKQESL